MGLGWSFALMRYGAIWRQHRRAFHKYFSPTAIPAWHPIMYEEIKAFLCKAKSQPDAVFDHVQMFVGQSLFELILQLTFGLLVNVHNQDVWHRDHACCLRV